MGCNIVYTCQSDARGDPLLAMSHFFYPMKLISASAKA